MNMHAVRPGFAPFKVTSASNWILRGLLTLALLLPASGEAQVAPPESLLLDGIPAVSLALRNKVSPYLESRGAAFNAWHPTRRELLITTRFADTMQLHQVRMPAGARRQLTFSPEPVSGASYRPRTAEFMVFSQDVGGGEFYQLFRYDPASGRSTLLTDGKSRNEGANWAPSGKWLAYTSTRRDGKNNDIYVIDPANPASDHCVLQVSGGGWSVQDWSPEESSLLLAEYISINKSHLHLLDLKSGLARRLTPDLPDAVAYGSARFAKHGSSFFAITDRDAEFRRVAEFILPTAPNEPATLKRVLTAHIPWDVGGLEISPDGKHLAFVANEAGLGVLHVMTTGPAKELKLPPLPTGIISGVTWHENNRDLGFTLSSARFPADVFSLDIKTRQVDRWTESETGGLNAAAFVVPELIKFKSFDGVEISAFVYRPDPTKFPGKRPAIINIHGGPESQSRPGFLARNNYFLEEMGIALVYPNVRGSDGYGKTFLTLDNGFKREDSVRDIGALLDWLARDSSVDPERLTVMGGSYGGYMVLSCLTHFSDRLRCAVDIVGISNFLTFLRNTQDYRRDLRRVEYGDERDEKMRDFLEKISPTTNVKKITRPLLVVQGKNDPRVPVTEAEQMVKAIRENGGTAWYLMAQDEGHGFAKKKNADFQFLATIVFLEQYLLH
jgi:dipeptidyl aminopeptidase/acylaminoacyl peptidase